MGITEVFNNTAQFTAKIGILDNLDMGPSRRPPGP